MKKRVIKDKGTIGNILNHKISPRFTQIILILFNLVIIGGLFFLACDNFFPSDDYKPSGNPFSLNPGIDLLGIRSSDTLYSPSGAFTLELRVKAASEKMDTLLAGLFFLSSDKGKKDMIIVKNFPIVAYASEKVYALPVFGVQRRREIPAETNYLFGPISDDPDLKQIVNILKRKRIEGRNVSLVQSAIYRITDGEELTQGLLDTLNALPDE